MNIFVTDPSPLASAITLDDKRLIKMVLESAQMLSTTMHTHGIANAPYKSTHKNHPCTIWVSTNQANFNWLLNHFIALCNEYTNRYGKIHKCYSYVDIFNNAQTHLPTGELTTFANCSRYKDMNVLEAYKLTMIDKWTEDKDKKRKATWTKRTPPQWINP